MVWLNWIQYVLLRGKETKYFGPIWSSYVTMTLEDVCLLIVLEKGWYIAFYQRGKEIKIGSIQLFCYWKTGRHMFIHRFQLRLMWLVSVWGWLENICLVVQISLPSTVKYYPIYLSSASSDVWYHCWWASSLSRMCLIIVDYLHSYGSKTMAMPYVQSEHKYLEE